MKAAGFSQTTRRTMSADQPRRRISCIVRGTASGSLMPQSQAQFNEGDYTASLQTLAALRGPVDAFFDDVMVNAQEMDLRLNRQGLQSLHQAMNRVADLSRLA